MTTKTSRATLALLIVTLLSVMFAATNYENATSATSSFRSTAPKKFDNATAPVQRPFKNFVYLIQTGEPTDEPRLSPTNDRDVLYLCYKTECNASSIIPPEDVTFAGGSWTEGRNALLEFAITRGKEMVGDRGYLYYVFMDDDVPSMVMGDDPWSLYEQWLLETRPLASHNAYGVVWGPKHGPSW